MRLQAFPVLLVSGATFLGLFQPTRPQDAAALALPSKTEAHRMLARLPAPFVPNLGQWDHPARFVHRTGSMTMFLEERGWILDLAEYPVKRNAKQEEPRASATLRAPEAHSKSTLRTRGVALEMTFEGDAHVPEIIGEEELGGHHNYFLGNDEDRWRTGVPLYGSVRYENLYPGIDLRLREVNGVPEYDLLLEPGADLSLVTVHVEGGQGLSIAGDGSLVIETELGAVTQPKPKTWQVGAGGTKHEVPCSFTLLGADRFGFTAPGWDRDTNLTIDPGLIWSTYLGSSSLDSAFGVSVDETGMVTVAGWSGSSSFPWKTGAYSSFRGVYDTVITRLDPSKSGANQLVYSTFLGGTGDDGAYAMSVDASGVVTVAGECSSSNYPTTSGAFRTAHSGGLYDGFVSRLDPSKSGTQQLVYSTYLGGNNEERPNAVTTDGSGTVVVVGWTRSSNFPSTAGAFDTTHNGSADAFVSRLDPSKSGTNQLVYSTFLGGSSSDYATAVSVDATKVVTVAGYTASSSFPATSGAYDSTHNGSSDGFLMRIDPSQTGSSQIVYSTFVGGSGSDIVFALAIDASGVVTLAGQTLSQNLPTTSQAFDRSHNGSLDAFVSRLDLRKQASSQLVYSTYLGGSGSDDAQAVAVDSVGVVTVAGFAREGFPTTLGAYDTTHTRGNWDAYVSRLDPSKSGASQLVYSTYLGGSGIDGVTAVAIDRSGVAAVVGNTQSSNFPTTGNAFDNTYNFGADFFVSRLDMGLAFHGDRHELLVTQGGTQKLTLNAGKQHAGRSYWILGSVTGTRPGIDLLGLHFPLVPDLYTNITIGAANPPIWSGFRGTLDSNGQATASLNIPKRAKPLARPITLYHAYLVYDAQGQWHMVSNPVPLTMK